MLNIKFIGGKMLKEFTEAFVLVFAAEVGDKTQLMLMTLSAKYSIMQMLLGILLGVVVNHGAAVFIGSFLSNAADDSMLQIFSGAMFIVFGIIIIVFDDENENKRDFKFGPVITTALTFFLGEMGDKTQLTAMTLAIKAKYPLIILSGSVAGMLAIGFVGIIIGTSLTKHIPSYIIKTISGLIFIIFGLMRLDG